MRPARLYGFNDYRELNAAVARFERSSGERTSIRSASRHTLVDKLIEIGMERADANAIVDTVRPAC